MPEKHTFSCVVGERTITVETGHIAEQAGAALIIKEGETMALVTATLSAKPRDVDFFPLSVDYEEKLYAAGRIPGNWFRREGRPPVQAILIARLTDRPLRPLFPKDMRNEVQVIVAPITHDQEHQVDILSVCGASAALTISNIPWDGPIAAVRVGLIDEELVINPTHSQMAESELDLRMAGTADAILMVECLAHQIDETTMVEALEFGHKAMQPFIQMQLEMREAIGKPKFDYPVLEKDERLKAMVSERIAGGIQEIITTKYDRDEREVALEDLRGQIMTEYTPGEQAEVSEETIDLKQVDEIFGDVLKNEVRRQILYEGVRPDGRDYTTIRPLSADVSFAPRLHGSGLFQRGQTQVLSILTLGMPGDAQELDGLEPADEPRRYMHHYNFPPYSTGETSMLRGPKRREIGHGALAENALLPVIPEKDEFPYAIRVVSEVLSSNGSTSMASVCGSTLALLDGGVPIKAPVAGIAMGLVTDGTKYAVLTDIQGLEDHLGDMDFKVAGTHLGITALQMDMKIKGISYAVMGEALEQARLARMEILDVIRSVLPEPRAELSNYAPRIQSVKIDSEKIGAVIGKGGETVRALQEKTGTRIDIEPDGMIYIAGLDSAGVRMAIETIMGLTQSVELGAIYTGKVVRIENYGVFVELQPGTDGLVHISQLDTYRVKSASDVVNLGDEIMVMVTDTAGGKIRLSRQAVLEGWTLEEARAADQGARNGGGSRGGGGDRGPRSGGGDRGGSRGGGDRGPRSGGGGGDRGPRSGGGGSGERGGGRPRRQD